MPRRKIAVLALSALVTSAVVTGVFAQNAALPAPDPAIAAMTADQKVAARQAAMKEDGGILRGASDLSGPDAVAAATKILTNFTNFPALFAEGSMTPQSHALPAIWEHFDEFKAIFATGQALAAQMLAAAQSDDLDAYDAAVQQLGQTCSTCHQTYRGR